MTTCNMTTDNMTPADKFNIFSLNTSGVNRNYLEFHYSRKVDYFLAKATEFFLKNITPEDAVHIDGLPGEQHLSDRYSILHRPFVKKNWISEEKLNNSNVVIFESEDDFNKKWIESYKNNIEIYEKVIVNELLKYKSKTYDSIIESFNRTDYKFTHLMLDFLDANREYIHEYLSLYENNITDPMFKIDKLVSFIETHPVEMFGLQEINDDQIIRLDSSEVLQNIKRSTNHNGTVTYYDGKLNLKEENDKFDVNKQTVYIGNKDVLFVNTHLTSKTPKKSPTNNYMTQFNKIIDECKNEDRLIIIFGDFNFDIRTLTNEYMLCIFIDNITCAKMRTGFQVQASKGNKLDESLKDTMFVFNNKKGIEFMSKNKNNIIKTMMLNGEKFNTDNLLPNKDHPSDHAIIFSSFNLD